MTPLYVFRHSLLTNADTAATKSTIVQVPVLFVIVTVRYVAVSRYYCHPADRLDPLSHELRVNLNRD
jgi:hypothetical protein